MKRIIILFIGMLLAAYPRQIDITVKLKVHQGIFYQGQACTREK